MDLFPNIYLAGCFVPPQCCRSGSWTFQSGTKYAILINYDLVPKNSFLVPGSLKIAEVDLNPGKIWFHGSDIPPKGMRIQLILRN